MTTLKLQYKTLSGQPFGGICECVSCVYNRAFKVFWGTVALKGDKRERFVKASECVFEGDHEKTTCVGGGNAAEQLGWIHTQTHTHNQCQITPYMSNQMEFLHCLLAP